MKITLRKIWEHYPCCENLGTHDADIEVSLIQILESNGIQDAVWALRCFDYTDYCLFLADVAVHADESAKEEKRKEIEILFIKHFGGK